MPKTFKNELTKNKNQGVKTLVSTPIALGFYCVASHFIRVAGLLRSVNKIIMCLILFLFSLSFNALAVDVIDLATRSVVKVQEDTVKATGFLIKAPNGKSYVITNNHVCYVSRKNTVERYGEFTEVPVTIVAQSVRYDLCALTPVPGLPLKLAKSPRAGTLIVAGHPKGQRLKITAGVRKGNAVDQEDYMQPSMSDCPEYSNKEYVFGVSRCIVYLEVEVITAEAALGSSGSPVLNDNGEVVGVVATASYNTSEGTGMIPWGHIKEFLETLK